MSMLSLAKRCDWLSCPVSVHAALSESSARWIASWWYDILHLLRRVFPDVLCQDRRDVAVDILIGPHTLNGMVTASADPSTRRLASSTSTILSSDSMSAYSAR